MRNCHCARISGTHLSLKCRDSLPRRQLHATDCCRQQKQVTRLSQQRRLNSHRGPFNAGFICVRITAESSRKAESARSLINKDIFDNQSGKQSIQQAVGSTVVSFCCSGATGAVSETSGDPEARPGGSGTFATWVTPSDTILVSCITDWLNDAKSMMSLRIRIASSSNFCRRLVSPLIR
jgi:hypothetical protein